MSTNEHEYAPARKGVQGYGFYGTSFTVSGFQSTVSGPTAAVPHLRLGPAAASVMLRNL